MSERFGAWFPLLLLAAVAAFTFWLEQMVQSYLRTSPGAVGTDPDYIVHGLSAVRLDGEGRIKHTLEAQKMTHFPGDDSTVLVLPRLVSHTDMGVRITVTAREAMMSANGEHVYFENDVRVVRAAHGSAGELTLETSYLHVTPELNVARTDRPVTIRDANSVVTASGLELQAEKRVLELYGRVRGTYHEVSRAR
jgi:lipopolysaccharide export system protein LptC